MSENIILLSGLFCFSLALVGLILTVLEFRRMGVSEPVKAARDSVRRVAPRTALRT